MRIPKIFFLILLVVLFSLSCEKIKTDDKKIQQKTVVVLFDLSGSTKDFRSVSFETFKKILSGVTHGDVIVATKITESSIVEPEIPVKEPFPEFVALDKTGRPTDNNFLIKQAKQEVDNKLANKKDEILKIVKDFLFAGNARKTDIMSSLHVAERIFKNYAHDKAILVIFSDMIEDSDVYNFENENLTQKRIEEIIKKEGIRHGMPELSGVKVYVVSAGKLSTDRFFAIQNFWLRYFKECGANLSKENYGSSLLNFNE